MKRKSGVINQNEWNVFYRLQLQGSQSLSESARCDVVEQLEAFLSSELTSYSCQICFELMAPPHRPPVLLFPCGHSFCKMCMERPGPSSTKCPYCRQVRCAPHRT